MNIGIIGSGTMGISIAHFMAQKNQSTTIFDSSKTSLKQGKKKLLTLINKLKEKEKYTDKEYSQILENLNFTEDIKKLRKVIFL
jgi:3-hydroxybutyryl-CoA dehydrogenase